MPFLVGWKEDWRSQEDPAPIPPTWGNLNNPFPTGYNFSASWKKGLVNNFQSPPCFTVRAQNKKGGKKVIPA